MALIVFEALFGYYLATEAHRSKMLPVEGVAMNRCLTVALAIAVMGVWSQASAHHSFAATYLEDQSVTIEGELVQFMFRNPHSFVHVMVKEKDSSLVRYTVEWGGAGQLDGQGVTRETLRPGDY